ncbi:MAG: argininosuccinate synthase, partial [Planctomycetota bacterium]|nr:argininosuccinate synthase [Planctomycetota bacterium]
MEKILLAYSGGLTTSVCIHYLRYKKGFEVLTFSADLGQVESADKLAERALKFGAHSVFIKDLRPRFAEEFIIPAIFANLRNSCSSHISVALSRPIITEEMLLVAREQNCRYVAHGGVPKSNDQIRFKLSLAALAPDLKIVTPMSEPELSSYSAIVAYATKNSLEVEREKKFYEEDHNIWGRTVKAPSLENLNEPPSEELFVLTKPVEKAADEPVRVSIGFEEGKPVSLNGEKLSLVELIERLNRIGGEHSIGRCCSVQEKIIGLKSRVVSEAPAASIIVDAHSALEMLVLQENLIYLKALIEQEYARTIYKGLYFTRLRRALFAFIKETQQPVTGTVTLKLFKGSCSVETVQSPYSLYRRELAT